MWDTIDAIVEGGEVPLSIIIVGVGEADFTDMNVLDADDCPLRSRNGRTMARDIVQFVPYRDVGKAGILAAEVLEELPGQFVGWAKMHGIEPT
jgi:hypothetical protein